MRQPNGIVDNENEPEENTDEFAVIEIRFSAYNANPFDKAIFSTNNYLLKKEKEFVPAKKYEGYTILLGSPNLIN